MKKMGIFILIGSMIFILSGCSQEQQAEKHQVVKDQTIEKQVSDSKQIKEEQNRIKTKNSQNEPLKKQPVKKAEQLKEENIPHAKLLWERDIDLGKPSLYYGFKPRAYFIDDEKKQELLEVKPDLKDFLSKDEQFILVEAQEVQYLFNRKGNKIEVPYPPDDIVAINTHFIFSYYHIYDEIPSPEADNYDSYIKKLKETKDFYSYYLKTLDKLKVELPSLIVNELDREKLENLNIEPKLIVKQRNGKVLFRRDWDYKEYNRVVLSPNKKWMVLYPQYDIELAVSDPKMKALNIQGSLLWSLDLESILEELIFSENGTSILFSDNNNLICANEEGEKFINNQENFFIGSFFISSSANKILNFSFRTENNHRKFKTSCINKTGSILWETHHSIYPILAEWLNDEKLILLFCQNSKYIKFIYLLNGNSGEILGKMRADFQSQPSYNPLISDSKYEVIANLDDNKLRLYDISNILEEME